MEIRKLSGPSKQEIESELQKMGDYVKMDYLSRCLENKGLDFDTKKFVLVSLAGLFEEKKMFIEAGKLIRTGADINTTFQNKINDFVKSGGLFVKGGNFDEADISFGKALACTTGANKIEIKILQKEIYKRQAKAYLQKDKRKHAARVYEKILNFELDIYERRKVQAELLILYEKLGKMDDYFLLRKKIRGY